MYYNNMPPAYNQQPQQQYGAMPLGLTGQQAQGGAFYGQMQQPQQAPPSGFLADLYRAYGPPQQQPQQAAYYPPAQQPNANYYQPAAVPQQTQGGFMPTYSGGGF